MSIRASSTAEAIAHRAAVGQLLQLLRERPGLSQGTMAQRIGAKQTLLSRWERGESHPPPIRLKVAAEALGESAAVFCAIADAAMGRAPRMAFPSAEGVAPTLEQVRARFGVRALQLLVSAAVYVAWAERR